MAVPFIYFPPLYTNALFENAIILSYFLDVLIPGIVGIKFAANIKKILLVQKFQKPQCFFFKGNKYEG